MPLAGDTYLRHRILQREDDAVVELARLALIAAEDDYAYTAPTTGGTAIPTLTTDRLTRSITDEAIASVATLSSTAADYELHETRAALGQAYQFFRRHDDGRYSSATKMRMLNLSEGSDPDSALRSIVVAIATPYKVDEETETKSGGLVGMAVSLASADNNARPRLCVAVAESARRKRVGTALVRYVQRDLTYQRTFIANHNQPGMAFAVANGFVPRAVNPNGTIEFGMLDDNFEVSP